MNYLTFAKLFFFSIAVLFLCFLLLVNSSNKEKQNQYQKLDQKPTATPTSAPPAQGPAFNQKSFYEPVFKLLDTNTTLTPEPECIRLRDEKGIIPGELWGRAKEEDKLKWLSLRCDLALTRPLLAQYELRFPPINEPIIVPADRKAPSPKTTDLEVIAIIVCTTTRNHSIKTIGEAAVFAVLIPSVVLTVVPGYEYWIYILYESHDAFFDVPGRAEEIFQFFTEQVEKPLKVRSIVSRLILDKFDNVKRKPGPIYNFATHLAYIDNVTYIYRVADDIELTTPWVNEFVGAMKNFGGPPYGVVGPTTAQNPPQIFLVEFTHRLHHEIFPLHYPQRLTDWGLDDWVTRVYGWKRAKKFRNVVVNHRLGFHGTLYHIDHGFNVFLEGELLRGRRVIQNWLLSRGLYKELLDYMSDDFYPRPFIGT